MLPKSVLHNAIDLDHILYAFCNRAQPSCSVQPCRDPPVLGHSPKQVDCIEFGDHIHVGGECCKCSVCRWLDGDRAVLALYVKVPSRTEAAQSPTGARPRQVVDDLHYSNNLLTADTLPKESNHSQDTAVSIYRPASGDTSARTDASPPGTPKMSEQKTLHCVTSKRTSGKSTMSNVHSLLPTAPRRYPIEPHCVKSSASSSCQLPPLT
eukprot:2663998-Rhodomonas_salina.2